MNVSYCFRGRIYLIKMKKTMPYLLVLVVLLNGVRSFETSVLTNSSLADRDTREVERMDDQMEG